MDLYAILKLTRGVDKGLESRARAGFHRQAIRFLSLQTICSLERVRSSLGVTAYVLDGAQLFQRPIPRIGRVLSPLAHPSYRYNGTFFGHGLAHLLTLHWLQSTKWHPGNFKSCPVVCDECGSRLRAAGCVDLGS